jgi:hypothetical protein
VKTSGFIIRNAIGINSCCFCKKFQDFSGIRSPEKLQSEKVRHDLPIYVGNFGFGGVLQLAKPAGRNFARLAFDVGKLFFQKKWVNIRSNELRQFVKMSFGSNLVWTSRKDFSGLFVERPNSATVVSESREMKLWDKMVKFRFRIHKKRMTKLCQRGKCQSTKAVLCRI